MPNRVKKIFQCGHFPVQMSPVKVYCTLNEMKLTFVPRATLLHFTGAGVRGETEKTSCLTLFGPGGAFRDPLSFLP